MEHGNIKNVYDILGVLVRDLEDKVKLIAEQVKMIDRQKAEIEELKKEIKKQDDLFIQLRNKQFQEEIREDRQRAPE